jgi:disulfide oxidoreductase YuzD
MKDWMSIPERKRNQIIYSIKAEEVLLNVEKLSFLLKRKVWGSNGKSYDLSPMEVIEDPSNKDYSYQQEKIEKADLKFPIFLVKKDGKLRVVDGYHRLAKAFQQGKKKIKAKTINQKEWEEIIEKSTKSYFNY